MCQAHREWGEGPDIYLWTSSTQAPGVAEAGGLGMLRKGPDCPSLHPSLLPRMWEQEQEHHEAAAPHPTPLGQQGGMLALCRRESKPGTWFEGYLPACFLFLEPNSEKPSSPVHPTPPPAADLLPLKSLGPAQGPSPGNAQEP